MIVTSQKRRYDFVNKCVAKGGRGGKWLNEQGKTFCDVILYDVIFVYKTLISVLDFRCIYNLNNKILYKIISNHLYTTSMYLQNINFPIQNVSISSHASSQAYYRSATCFLVHQHWWRP